MSAEVRAIGRSWQRWRRGCKHGSGDGITGICVYRKYPVGTSRCDVKRSTGNELSRWSIKAVNRHPTQADTHGGGFAKK